MKWNYGEPFPNAMRSARLFQQTWAAFLSNFSWTWPDQLPPAAVVRPKIGYGYTQKNATLKNVKMIVNHQTCGLSIFSDKAPDEL